MTVHPSAIIHKDAGIDPTTDIGPYVIIGAKVEIGPRCVIRPYVQLDHALIGEGTDIGSHTLIGGDPQMVVWKDAPSLVRIGKNNIIRELVTIHRSKDENAETIIGDNNYLMSNIHIGHDCIIGNNTIITTFAGLSGHVTVQDYAIIGGQAGIHQFVRIGEMAMIGGMARIVQDVAPYMLAEGSPADIRNTNVVGLRRKGFTEKARANIKEAFKILFKSGLNLKSACARLADIPDGGDEIRKIIDFISSTKRGLTGI